MFLHSHILNSGEVEGAASEHGVVATVGGSVDGRTSFTARVDQRAAASWLFSSISAWCWSKSAWVAGVPVGLAPNYTEGRMRLHAEVVGGRMAARCAN